MGNTKRTTGNVILKEAVGDGGGAIKNPTVLSCGGIYIPRRGDEDRVLYQIITTSNKSEPVKVVTGARPRNSLREVLLKESMN